MESFSIKMDGKEVVSVDPAPGGYIAKNEHGGMIAVGTWSKIWPRIKKFMDRLILCVIVLPPHCRASSPDTTNIGNRTGLSSIICGFR